MTTPVYVGMPTVDRTFEVPKAAGGRWGVIRCGGPCKDDYGRIIVWNQPGEGATIKLQGPAIESFKVADAAVFQATGHHIVCSGTWRSCADQTRYYASDPKRYAAPSTTAHCRGLAIDVSQALPQRVRLAVDLELQTRGWHQARLDEPWHYSFGLKV